jgi:hypothetical protein
MACKIDFPNTHIMDINEIEDNIIDLQKNYLVKSGLLKYINEHLVRGFASKNTVTLTIYFCDYYSEEFDYFDDDDNYNDAYEKICELIENMCHDAGITAIHGDVDAQQVEFTFEK